MFENFDFTNFWDDNPYSLKEYVGSPPSDQLIAEIEQELGYKLPASYIWLMKQHNGGAIPAGPMTMWPLKAFLALGGKKEIPCAVPLEVRFGLRSGNTLPLA